MKTLTAVLLLTLFGALHADAAPRWLRRVTMVAACAACAADAVTTYQGAQAGLVEANPLLRGPNGQPRVGRMIGLKLGLCGGMAVVQEMAGKRHNTAWSVVNAAQAGMFSYVALRNRALIKQVR